MARRRKRFHKKSGVHAAPHGGLTGAGDSRRSVLAAAEIVAAQVRKNASFSKRIVAATHAVGVAEEMAAVDVDGAEAPMAVSYEFGQKHPLNYPNQVGSPNAWGKTPRRPFMDRAARSKRVMKAALDVYGSIEAELIAIEHGFDQEIP